MGETMKLIFAPKVEPQDFGPVALAYLSPPSGEDQVVVRPDLIE